MKNYYYVAIAHGTTLEIISEPFLTESEAFKEIALLDTARIEGNVIVVSIPADQIGEI